MLCCAVLCCAVLCCAVLCCAVLCCAVLCCAVLCCAVLIISEIMARFKSNRVNFAQIHNLLYHVIAGDSSNFYSVVCGIKGTGHSEKGIGRQG